MPAAWSSPPTRSTPAASPSCSGRGSGRRPWWSPRTIRCRRRGSREFARGRTEWLVAVRMVSEGVDIPRLRVGVFATTTTTDLFFRQAVGRFVRWMPGIRDQRAWLFLPDDPRLRARAAEIAEQRRPLPATLDARPEDDDQYPARNGELPGAEEDQLSMFAPLSAVALAVASPDPDSADWRPWHEPLPDDEGTAVDSRSSSSSRRRRPRRISAAGSIQGAEGGLTRRQFKESCAWPTPRPPATSPAPRT